MRITEYYSSLKLTQKECPELSREERIQKRLEYLKKYMKKIINLLFVNRKANSILQINMF